MRVIPFTKVLLAIAIVYGLCAFQLSAVKDVDVKTDTIGIKLPSNFPKPLYQVTVTKQGFILGKELFYEPRISANSLVACSNCHRASAAFGDLNNAVSAGVEGRKGDRNSLPLFNLLWQKNFMWDGRVLLMKNVPVNALTSHVEMGTTMDNAVRKLRSLPEYSMLFKRAYGSEPTADLMLDALMQFTASMVSANSKYDQVMRKENDAVFSEKEQSGYLLFKDKCSSCHAEPLFTDGTFRNNGLELKSVDIGRDTVTHRRKDVGKFRVPSLRNVEMTAPYMHDGRFRSLKEVLQHYHQGVKAHQNLDRLLMKGNNPGIQISAAEQDQIIAFLKTLSDVDFINDRRFNNRHN